MVYIVPVSNSDETQTFSEHSNNSVDSIWFVSQNDESHWNVRILEIDASQAHNVVPTSIRFQSQNDIKIKMISLY